MNLSQIKREKMMAFLKKLKEENSGNEENLIAINEIENELNNKKYGLIWEEHEENVDKMMEDNVPVFVEDKSREIKANEDEYNFLLEGDNLHSLYLLDKTHKGKIDVIYIDPPYNTGNKDFVYDDNMVGDDDGYRHSKWLSFMYKRLLIAKDLLSKNGLLFISIGEDEIAQLKMLCNSLLLFQSTIIRVSTKRVKGDKQGVNEIHDYVLMYSNIENCPIVHKNKSDYSIYELEDEHIKERGKYLIRPLDNSAINYSKNCDYVINAPDGTKIYAGGDKNERDKRIRDGANKKDWCFRWSKEKFEWGLKNDFIVFKKSKDIWRCYFKIYQFVDNELNPTQKYDNHLSVIDEYYNNQGTTELKNVLDTLPFSYPKPLGLIKDLISMTCHENPTILDFFAGSGTTAQAVLELNKEDGGNRHFILCTNNENNICEDITYKRIKTVITGKRDDGSTYSDGIPANLKYYKTDFVKKDTKNLSRDLSKHVKELIQLENGVDIDNDNWVMILTEEDAEKFEKNIKKYKNLKGVYRARSVVWTKSQKVLLKGKEDHIIPDYYFNNELKEVGENW